MRGLCAAVVGLILATIPAQESKAQTFPTRPISWIIPFPPGGNTDTTARAVTKLVSEDLGYPIVIENRGGAGGIIGTEQGVRAKPDGHTLLFGTAGTIVANPALLKNLSFDPLAELQPVHGLAETPVILLVNPGRPYKTLQEFLDFAKENPGAINYASAGTGTTAHLAGELFQQVAGIKLTHVPYKGTGPALVDLLAGVVDVMFDYPVTTLPHIRDRKIHVLAALTRERVGVLPDVPTARELGLTDAVIGSWSGVFVPKDTPAPVVAKLDAAFDRALRSTDILRHFSESGQVVLTEQNSQNFGKFVGAEAAKIKGLVERAGASAF